MEIIPKSRFSFFNEFTFANITQQNELKTIALSKVPKTSDFCFLYTL